MLALAVLVTGCPGSPGPAASTPWLSGPEGSGTAGPSILPPIPSSSGGNLGPDQPPIGGVGGEVRTVKADRLELREAVGSVVTLRLLAGDATSFLRISAGTWLRADRRADVEVGMKACVETLMDGQTLLALRVFLGADCGPSL